MIADPCRDGFPTTALLALGLHNVAALQRTGPIRVGQHYPVKINRDTSAKKRIWSVANLKVKVRFRGVSGGSEGSDYLSAGYQVSSLYGDTRGTQVCVKGIDIVAVLNQNIVSRNRSPPQKFSLNLLHSVSVRFITFGRLPKSLWILRNIVDHRFHASVGGCHYLLAVCIKVAEVGSITTVRGTAGSQLNEVKAKLLGQCPSVSGIKRRTVSGIPSTFQREPEACLHYPVLDRLDSLGVQAFVS